NEYKRNRILGFLIGAQKPISKFTRFEASLTTNYTEHARIEEYRDIFGFLEENEYIEDSYITMIPGVKYIWDNTIWEYTYPVNGSRVNIHYENSPKINSESLQFRVVIDPETASFNREGKSVFCKFVKDVDENLRCMDECIVVTPNDELVAFGKLIIAPEEIDLDQQGMAIRVRSGVPE
ncbi:MAG: PUA domain-containing protein, partial [Candidatus Thermoplasmatota archaeon]|nr:PUA domain-containing protein [Candidatus Thermoplasmatota archaeon]